LDALCGILWVRKPKLSSRFPKSKRQRIIIGGLVFFIITTSFAAYFEQYYPSSTLVSFYDDNVYVDFNLVTNGYFGLTQGQSFHLVPKAVIPLRSNIAAITFDINGVTTCDVYNTSQNGPGVYFSALRTLLLPLIDNRTSGLFVSSQQAGGYFGLGNCFVFTDSGQLYPIIGITYSNGTTLTSTYPYYPITVLSPTESFTALVTISGVISTIFTIISVLLASDKNEHQIVYIATPNRFW
jgi:hypothetical protein